MNFPALNLIARFCNASTGKTQYTVMAMQSQYDHVLLQTVGVVSWQVLRCGTWKKV